jgi:hypothetical protein|tara:strand:- start:78 stop:314 length:237 start_codon:yes stop_codon:yes gene_type:complete
MFKLYDYKCVLGHLNEHLVKGSPDTQLCKTCGAYATRQLCSPTSYLEPFSGDFAGASIKWANKHEKGRAQAEKANPEY